MPDQNEALQAKLRLAMQILDAMRVNRTEVIRTCGLPTWRDGVNGTYRATEASVAKAHALLERYLTPLFRFLADSATPGLYQGDPHMDNAQRMVRAMLHAPATELARTIAQSIHNDIEAELIEIGTWAALPVEAREAMRAEGRKPWSLPTPEEEAELDAQTGGWGPRPTTD